MKKTILVLFALFIVFLFHTDVIACSILEEDGSTTMTISISGLGGTNKVEAFSIYYTVEDFAYDNFALGSAVPPAIPGYDGWENDLLEINSGEFRIAYHDEGYLKDTVENPLLDGIIATFDYKGSITGYNSSYTMFGDKTGTAFGTINLQTLTDTNTHIQGTESVPIPGTVLLLGSGLLGLIGVRSRRTKRP